MRRFLLPFFWKIRVQSVCSRGNITPNTRGFVENFTSRIFERLIRATTISLAREMKRNSFTIYDGGFPLSDLQTPFSSDVVPHDDGESSSIWPMQQPWTRENRAAVAAGERRDRPGVGSTYRWAPFQAILQKLYERLDSHFRQRVHHRGRFHGENNEREGEKEPPFRGYEEIWKPHPIEQLYFITHEDRHRWKESSRVSFLSGPWNSRRCLFAQTSRVSLFVSLSQATIRWYFRLFRWYFS